ncbi:hypothetical protein [Actinoplanes regularis]|uniref:Uncharacterized protein n=1 Tax=Actinoplanes regularis TaxID=52697 RepID=A0A239B539_9ACTN|nr:hypothetical protein [Actinoplanes regularis]GIE87180.1 hypothetical protein Are01nite_36600 [Actinoplanes regularis]SNS02334.1 hypothetical protein SAMN06264365_108305 [Actinoplanes regularis]
MTRRFRYRMTALVAGGLIFGVPLLIPGAASADPAEPSSRRATFDGGVLGLTCGSKPRVEKMTVPEESAVQVVNRTGHDARLEVGGEPKGVIPADGATEVLFRRGTTPVRLTPTCASPSDPVPMLVTAVPSTAATLTKPTPSDSDATSRTPAASGSSKQAPASGSALPDTSSPDSRPARPTQATSQVGLQKPDAESQAARAKTVGGAPAAPLGDADQQIKSMIAGTSEAGDPTFAGMPPGDGKALLPADRALAGLTATDLAAPVSAGPLAGQSDEPVAAPAVEEVAAIEPLRTGRPIGLLGLVAIVCALGVLAAAIRAIVSQRASRSNLA